MGVLLSLLTAFIVVSWGHALLNMNNAVFHWARNYKFPSRKFRSTELGSRNSRNRRKNESTPSFHDRKKLVQEAMLTEEAAWTGTGQARSNSSGKIVVLIREYRLRKYGRKTVNISVKKHRFIMMCKDHRSVS